MNTIVILYVWTVVAASYSPAHGTRQHLDWRNLGEYASVQKCEDASKQFGIHPKRIRCVDTGRTK